LATLLFGACATSPDALRAIKHDVDSRLTYVRYFAKDYRHIPSPATAEGNCAVFAATYKGEAAAHGIEGDIRVCRLWNGDGRDGGRLRARCAVAVRRHAGGCWMRAVKNWLGFAVLSFVCGASCYVLYLGSW
jgi:hypothetical protein